MEEKSPAALSEQGNVSHESDIMESDGLSASASITESAAATQNAAVDKKPESSPIQSEPTSGIGTLSRSTTVSETPCEGATSDSEPKKIETSIESEPKVEISRDTTSASELSCDREASDTIEAKSEVPTLPPESKVEVESGSISTAEASSEDKSNSNEKTKDQPALSNETQPKKSFVQKLWEAFSPKKLDKAKENPSKPVSPAKKSEIADVDNSKQISKETEISSESAEDSKKGSEKEESIARKLKRKMSVIKIPWKNSAEKVNLVANEETNRTEEPTTSDVNNQPEKIAWSAQCTCPPEWSDNTDTRSSVTENQSVDGTNVTDIPSTCSGADVFPSDSSTKPSERGENTSEEAVAGSLVSSTDEEIPEIKNDKEAESECTEKGPSADETLNTVPAENGKGKEHSSETSPSDGEILKVVVREKEIPPMSEDVASSNAETQNVKVENSDAVTTTEE